MSLNIEQCFLHFCAEQLQCANRLAAVDDWESDILFMLFGNRYSSNQILFLLIMASILNKLCMHVPHS